MIPAPAIFNPNQPIKIINAVIVRELFTGFDASQCVDENTFPLLNGLAIGFTGMIQVARRILLHVSVDRPWCIGDIKIIFPSFYLCHLFIAYQRAPVFDHKIPALDGCERKKPKAGGTAFHLKFMRCGTGFFVGHGSYT